MNHGRGGGGSFQLVSWHRGRKVFRKFRELEGGHQDCSSVDGGENYTGKMKLESTQSPRFQMLWQGAWPLMEVQCKDGIILSRKVKSYN